MASFFSSLLSPITNLFKKATPTVTSTPAVPRPSQSSYDPYASSAPPSGFSLSAVPQVLPTVAPVYLGPGGNPSVPSTANVAPKAPVVAPKAAITPSAPKTPILPQIAPSAPVAPPLAVGGTPELPQGAPQAPAVPSVSPEAQNALDLANKAYEQSLKLSPDELTTQEDLDKLIESTRSAYTNIEDKAIPMQFITGQLASVERRATNLAEPLQNKLARLQATRQASLESSKFALERSQKVVDAEKSAAQLARTEAESARRFGVEQAGTAESRALQTKQFELNKAEADRKFAEDKRQFGLEYALDQQKIASAATEKAATTAAANEGAVQLRDNALSSAQDLLTKFVQGKGTSAVGKSGFLGSFGYSLIPGTARADFTTQFNNLKSLLSLENIKYLKGQGQVSDAERKLLAEASAKLELSQSEDEFKSALSSIVGNLGGAETYTVGGKTYKKGPDGLFYEQ